MESSQLMSAVGMLIYASLAVVALWGVFCVILALTRIEKKRFRSSETEALFFSKMRESLQGADYEEAIKVCNSPPYWDRAVARLAALAIENRKDGSTKIRRMIVERFQRDVLADLEYRISWVQTVIKSSPMLGLLGTVIGMIGAFGKMAGAQRVDPTGLARDISFALNTTAIGLAIAIPLVLCGAYINVRMRKLEDDVEDGVGRFLEEFATHEGADAPRRQPQYAQPT
jgi:biopolymer transport protein ExbB